VFAGAGIDSLNPKITERTLAVATVAIGILKALFDAFDGNAEIVFSPASITTGAIQNFFVTGVSGDAPFDACHDFFPPQP
jgi:hypothetical protein